MKSVSQSTSELLTQVIDGPAVPGACMSRRHLQFGDYVISLTPRGDPRMPNGIECDIDAAPGACVAVGGGRLLIDGVAIEPGPGWNPKPSFEKRNVMPAGPAPLVQALAGRGPGLTPEGDDVLAGYVAGLVLLHGQRKRAAFIANRAAALTSSLSATLLRHAARGEVPEVVHTLLETGDARPLLAFGHSSGQAWLRGLVSAGYTLETHELALLATGSRR